MAKVLLLSVAGSNSPCMAHASTVLADDCRNDPSAIGLALRTRAGLLLELSAGRSQRVLAWLVGALGDAPGTLILLGPERPARMHQQHLDAAAPAAVEQNAGAALGHEDHCKHCRWL